ncbi:MAG: hypothetical protein K6F49_06570 [Saccharofermentans sp.]|nr:hypothetical protein [Saccharofermentans sp.]
MFKKIVLVAKIVISLLLIAACILLVYRAAFREKYEDTREVLDTVISEDGSHKAVVTKIGDSYGYDDTVEFALFDDEGKQNAIFVVSVYNDYSGEKRYDVDFEQEQVIISVNDQQDIGKACKILVDYSDIAGRDVSFDDHDNVTNVLGLIWGISFVLFVASVILLMFSKERKVIFGITTAVLILVNMILLLGFNIGRYDLSLNDVIYEENLAADQELRLKNLNYEFFKDSLNRVHIFYHSSEKGNLSLSTYASGKVDKTKIDAVFMTPNSTLISIRGEDSFEFTIVRE